MIAFIIIILICVLALGISLLVNHWSNGAKSGEAVKIETLYKKNWLSFFLDIPTCVVVCFGYCLFVFNVTCFVCR